MTVIGIRFAVNTGEPDLWPMIECFACGFIQIYNAAS
jgi:hypothetical protein